MPKLKSNWRELALKAYSMYALYASLLVQAADALLPYWLDYSSPPYLKGIAFAVTMTATYVRLLPQTNLPKEP